MTFLWPELKQLLFLGANYDLWPLLETHTLPSACGTRQSPKYTRQRALGKELIGKEAFAECRKSTRQRFTLGKMKMRKNPKIIAKFFNFFFGGGHHQPAPARLHRSRCIFCAKFVANVARQDSNSRPLPRVSAALPLHYTVTCV